jgi:hypothetical protein
MQCARSGRFKPEFVRRTLVTSWLGFWRAITRSRLLSLRRRSGPTRSESPRRSFVQRLPEPVDYCPDGIDGTLWTNGRLSFCVGLLPDSRPHGCWSLRSTLRRLSRSIPGSAVPAQTSSKRTSGESGVAFVRRGSFSANWHCAATKMARFLPGTPWSRSKGPESSGLTASRRLPRRVSSVHAIAILVCERGNSLCSPTTRGVLPIRC